MSGAPLAGSFDLAWSSNIPHIIIPIYALVDWLLLPDRTKLPRKGLWLILIYPLVWLIVILIRGERSRRDVAAGKRPRGGS